MQRLIILLLLIFNGCAFGRIAQNARQYSDIYYIDPEYEALPNVDSANQYDDYNIIEPTQGLGPNPENNPTENGNSGLNAGLNYIDGTEINTLEPGYDKNDNSSDLISLQSNENSTEANGLVQTFDSIYYEIESLFGFYYQIYSEILMIFSDMKSITSLSKVIDYLWKILIKIKDYIENIQYYIQEFLSSFPDKIYDII